MKKAILKKKLAEERNEIIQEQPKEIKEVVEESTEEGFTFTVDDIVDKPKKNKTKKGE